MFYRRAGSSKRKPRALPGRRRLHLEALEDRIAPTTCPVTLVCQDLGPLRFAAASFSRVNSTFSVTGGSALLGLAATQGEDFLPLVSLNLTKDRILHFDPNAAPLFPSPRPVTAPSPSACPCPWARASAFAPRRR